MKVRTCHRLIGAGIAGSFGFLAYTSLVAENTQLLNYVGAAGSMLISAVGVADAIAGSHLYLPAKIGSKYWPYERGREFCRNYLGHHERVGEKDI